MMRNEHTDRPVVVPATGAPRRNKSIVAAAFVTVAAMVAMTYAAVPLYQLFCQVTGFAGTTQIAANAPGAVGIAIIAIRFDANVAPNLAWRFAAPRLVRVRLGEERLVEFTATNVGKEPLLGTATFNVTPLHVGKYFNKIQCFCFTEQLLVPGESKAFPVAFFVDPAIAEDDEGKNVNTITLSYTFFNKGRLALEAYLRTHHASAASAGTAAP
jgi:cytochrome c oxidase assembly protein subunit 11